MQQEKLKILYYQHNKVLELFSTEYVYHQSNYVYIRSHHFPVSCLKMSEWMLVSLSGCWNLFNFTAQKYYNSWRCLMFAIALSCSVMQSLGSFLQIHGISWNLFVEPDFIYHCTLPFKFISSYIYSHLTMQFQILGYWFGLAVNIHRSYFETFFACQIK